jgi:hypothetical protein
MPDLTIDVGDRVMVAPLEVGEPIFGVVGEKFERYDGGWNGEYIKVFDPATKQKLCTTLLGDHVILL